MGREQDQNLLRHEGIPTVFSNRALAKEVTEGLRREQMTLGELELEKLERINHVLEHRELYGMIEEGKLTLGIIKPQANKSKGLTDHDNDQEAADKLIDEIKQDIGPENVIFSFSTQFSGADADKFYRHVKEKFTGKDYNDPEAGQAIWQSIYDFSQSGPLTFMLLYREQGDAVEWWREKMGATHPNEAKPGSIRGDYAIEDNLPNNLVHGSDAIASVNEEIDVLKVVTRELVKQSVDARRLIPKEETLRQFGIVPQDSEILAVERIFDSGRRSESWIYGYQAVVYSQDKGLHRVFFKEKHFISDGGNFEGKAKGEYQRMEQLEALGIPQPKKYGVIRAAIYQEWVVNDQTELVLGQIGQEVLSDQAKNWLDQLIFIGRTLDSANFRPLNFIADLIFDPDRQQFLYMDFGFDLGESSRDRSNFAERTLLQRFPKYKEYIRQQFSV